MGDVELILVTWLRAAPLSFPRVFAGRIPANPTWPLVVVTELDVVGEARATLGHHLVQVDVWGDGNDARRDARLNALTIATAATQDLPGYTTDGATVSECFVSGISPQPDPETRRERFAITLEVWTR
jgi:hypothetical protein